MLLDLSAAFDTIDHGILSDRLESQFGISGLALAWLKSVWKNTMCFLQWYFINFYCCEVWSSPGLCSGPFALLFIYFTSQPNYSELWNTFPLLCGRHSAVCALKIWWQFSNHETRDVPICSEEVDVRKGPAAKFGKHWDAGHRSARHHVDQVTDLILHSLLISTSKKWPRSLSTICTIITKIRSFLSTVDAEILIHAFVSSKLDYCNASFSGLPCESTKSQMVQNSAARVFTRTRKFDHITPILASLHWLPVWCWWHTKLYTALPLRTCQISFHHIFQLGNSTLKIQGSWWFPADIRQSGSVDAFKSKLKTPFSL